ncbi:SCO1664 family protein [Pedococcus sp. KACC 23699]|uniref:SCO1664 family protein n=1 Tax=Pedococcus sp. KACC 23699 TaxID=3149228 RepID=A0AAU7JZS8_9MICO
MSPRERLQALSPSQPAEAVLLDVLSREDLEVVGRIADASNFAVLVRVGEDGPYAIYKPVQGERPLWDFPDGTLAGREVACYLISAAGGWDVVPPTVLRSGPQGLGSVQAWVGDPGDEPKHPVDVVAPGKVPSGWLPVLRGENELGEPVVVVHEDSAPARSVAAFDALVNNSDRKGSHLVRDGDRLRGFDHGVSLHMEPKLRTVLWGFAGDPLPDAELARIAAVCDLLEDEESELRVDLDALLTINEVAALLRRGRRLLDRAAYPMPSGQWPAIPWPPL